MYIFVYIRRFYFLYGGWQTPYFRGKHVSIMRHTREKQNLFSPFHVVVGDGVAVVAMSALFYYLSYRLVFYNFFSTGTWIKLRRVMQTVVRYFPDEASQVRARPFLSLSPAILFNPNSVSHCRCRAKINIILEFVCVTFMKCGISVIERQNNWQIFSQVIFETNRLRPPTQLSSARAPNYSVLCGLWNSLDFQHLFYFFWLGKFPDSQEFVGTWRRWIIAT